MPRPGVSSVGFRFRIQYVAAATLGAGLMSIAVAGCVSDPTPEAMRSLDDGQAQRVNSICETTLGARPGDSYFETCQSSLAGVLAQKQDERRLLEARAACTHASLMAGSPEFAVCVLRNQPSPDGRPQTTVIRSADSPVRLKSLSLASQEDVRRRTQLSCAMLGLDPAEAAFSNCVSDLQSGIAQINMPPAQ